MTKNIIMDNGGITIVGWQNEADGCFYLVAYEDGIKKEVSIANPNVAERGIFIQRWF
jgi:hypothetical protein